MDLRRVLDGRWMLLLGLGLVAGVSWMILRAVGPAFVATVSWTLATGPATPRVGVEAFRQVLVQDGILDGELGSTASEASTDLAPVATENRLDVVAGLGDGALVTLLRLRVTDRTPWAAMLATWDAARKLEAWDRRSASKVVTPLIAEVDAAIEALTGQIRIRQVFEAPASTAAIQADLGEREALMAFRDRLAAFAEGAPSGLLRRSGTVSVFLSPGASPAAVTAAPLLAVTVGMLALLVTHGVVGAAWSHRPQQARRVLASAPGAAPDHAGAVRRAIGAISDAILDRHGDASHAVVAFTSPVTTAGRTRVACLVAEELARRGRRVLLVDAVLHAPAIADRYRRLTGAIDVDEFRHAASTLDWLERPMDGHVVTSVQLGDAFLDVIPQHHPVWLAPRTAAPLFDAALGLLDRWKEYQVVIVDASASDAERGTDWLAPHATGIVIVSNGDSADRARLKEARTLERRYGRRVLGVVAWLDEAPT